MIGIEGELSIFLQAILCGCTVLLVYFSIRIMRRLIRHNLILISLEDFLFWIGTGLYLFVQMYHTSDGSIRWFFVVGVLTGGIGTYGTVRSVGKLCGRIYANRYEKEKKSID